MVKTTMKSLSVWKRPALILLALVCCLAWIIPVQSQGEDSATLQAELGDLIRAGKYDEATVVARKVIANHEKVFGPDHFETAIVVGQLADILRTQGRDEEAQPLYVRTLAIFEKTLGPDSRDVATTLGNLAWLYKDQGRYDAAEPLYVRSLAILEKTLDPGDPLISKALNNLAVLYQVQGRLREAEPILQRSLALSEKSSDPDGSAIAAALNNLAALYEDEGRLGEAESLYKRSVDLYERARGPTHINVATLRANLGMLALLRHQWAEAAEDFRRSAAVIQSRIERGLAGSDRNSAKGEAQRNSGNFVGLIKASNRLVMDGGAARSEQSRTLFETAQWALSSEAAATLAQMALRSAKGSTEIATLVRERQDLIREWQTRDKQLIAVRSEPPSRRNAAGSAALIERLAAIDTRLGAIDARLTKEFPEYAALSTPKPISASDIQSNLRADEALVLFLDTGDLFKPLPEETFVWVVTKSDVRWVRSELGRNTLTREVAALRCGLDFHGAWTDSHCSDLLKIAYTRADHDVFGKPLPFDLERAHHLYKGLFGEIEELIKDKRLLIVPSGPLTQLPFQVLVTEPPKTALPHSAADYRDVAWLARKHAISVLPTVSSLRALRELAKESHASESYIGIGNPLLDGEPERFKEDAAAAKLAREKRCDSTLRQRVASILGLRGGTRAITRGTGGIADVADIRTWAPLPETADELCEVAHALGVDPKTHLYLGAMATESKVKQLSEDGSLAKYKIVHFATHGAVAGEISQVSEPGLLLTPPDNASETDDGYLSASEVAGLKLDADWVILSACNTAAGAAKGAEALSGLARAFFYAGDRSLLVSHWEVASESTVKLITKAFNEITHNPKIGRAEALRRSMLSMITNGKDYEVHPAYWAPFVLVGEGGAER